MLLDATLREEQVCAGEVLVAANGEGEVCLIEKMGGVAMDPLMLLRSVDVAVSKIKELAQVVKAALELDANKRDRGGILGVELRAANERWEKRDGEHGEEICSTEEDYHEITISSRSKKKKCPSGNSRCWSRWHQITLRVVILMTKAQP